MNKIESLLQETRQNNWPYPKRFAAMKNTGVSSHEVYFINGYNSIYYGDFGTWQEPTLTDYTPPHLSDIFSQQEIQAVLKERSQGKISYMQFLTELATRCGVSHYKANMLKGTVIYFNNTEDKWYEQIVPIWTE